MTGHADPQLEAYFASVEAALADLRRYLNDGQAGQRPPAATIAEPARRADLVGKEWIEAGMAASRFGVSKDTIWRWCKNDSEWGWRRGGRWFVSISRMRAKLNIR